MKAAIVAIVVALSTACARSATREERLTTALRERSS